MARLVRRFVLAMFFTVLNLFGLLLALVSMFLVYFEHVPFEIPEGGFGGGDSIPKLPPTALTWRDYTGPVFVVAAVFLLDVAALWALTKIGGPLKADVKATIKKFGGSVWIAGAGLIGAFLAVSIVAFAMIFILSK